MNEESILIGHSCGCAFLTHWLSENYQKIDKLILVAPSKVSEKEDEASKEFYGFKINESLNERVNEIIIFTANDEREDGKKSLELYTQILDAKVIELQNHCHFTMRNMGKIEFPELLEVISS